MLEQRLAGFRREMTLHITVNLRSRIDVLNFQQTESFQALKDATKEGAQKILEALSDSRDHLVATTGSQTKQMRALHTHTETILSQEFKSAAANSKNRAKQPAPLRPKNNRAPGRRYLMPSLM